MSYSLKKINTLIIFFILVLITLVMRLQDWHNIVPNWDESTYLIMGKYYLTGGLNGLDYFDNKSSSLFYCYALLILLFGKNILGVKIAGVFLISIISLQIYYLSHKIHNNKIISFLSSVILIFFFTFELKNGTALYSQYISLIFFLSGLTFILSSKYFYNFLSGLFFCLSLIIRPDIYPIAIILLLTFFFENKLKNNLVFYLGGFFAITLEIFPYIITDNFEIYINNLEVLKDSGNYYIYNDTFFIKIINLIKQHIQLNSSFFLNFHVFILGFFGFILFLYKCINNRIFYNNYFIAIYLGVLIYTLILYLNTVPSVEQGMIFLITFNIFFSNYLIIFFSTRKLISYFFIIIIIFFHSNFNVYLNKYHQVIKKENNNVHNLIFKFINENNFSNKKILAINGHVIHFLLENNWPIHKTVHPSNLEYDLYIKSFFKEKNIKITNVYYHIFKKKPEIIIIKKNLKTLLKDQLYKDEILKEYFLLKKIENYQIYSRK